MLPMLLKMFWKVYLISVVNIIVLESVGTDTTLSPSLNALLRLMRMTENTCGNIEWCTVNTENVSIPFMGGCCASCFCDEECAESKTCCPDLTLSELMKGKVFMSIADLEFALSNDTIANSFQYDTIDDVVKERNDKKTTECINARVFDATPLRPKSSMYYMVSKCSKTTAVGEKVKTKCESPTVKTENVHIEDFIPLQSMSTGVVYRNRYCMLCNDAENDTLTEWEVYITTLTNLNAFLNGHFSSMSEIFTMIFQKDAYWGSFDVTFEPDNEIMRVHPPRQCHNLDFQYCKSDNMTMKAERDACRKYVLPVYVEMGRKLITLKNLACLSCNGHNLENSNICRRYGLREEVEPFLGRIQKEYIRRDMEQNDKTDIKMKFSSRCDPGHVYDSRVGACRKIYCPCGMVVHRGECVFIFQEFFYKVYEVHVDISPSTMPARGLNMTLFQSALFQYFKHVFENDEKLTANHIVLMVSKGNHRANRFFAYLVFSGQSSFPDVIYFVANHLRGLKTIAMEDITTPVKIALTDTVRVAHGFAIDLQTGYEYEAVLSTSDVFADTSLVVQDIIPLSECSLCHRIELEDDEMQFSENGRSVFIKPTKLVDVRFSLIKSNGTGVLVCAAKVMVNVDIEKPFETGSEFHDTEADKTVDEGDGTNKTAMLVTGMFVVLVVCLIVAIRVCLKRCVISSNFK